MFTVKTYKFKLLALVLSMLMVVASVPSMAYAGEDSKPLVFADMPNNWATEALENAVKNGLINGYIENGKNLIKPNGILRRNEMLTIVARAFGAQVVADLSTVSDVPEGIWYEDSIGKAVQMGITDIQTKMVPTKTVTREEVFTTLAKAFKLKTTDNDFKALESFIDNEKISSSMLSHMNAIVEAGYLEGYPDGTLRPKASITRAEFATIMSRLVQEYIYTPGEVTEVPDKGNVLIRSEDVILKDLTIKGDLIIADGVGDGEVTLDGVKIEGRLVVRGGGTNSIIIKGSSSIDRIIVSRVDSEVRIAVEGGANVEYIYIDDGSDDVIVTGTVKTLEIVANDIKVVANKAKIESGIITGENSYFVINEDSEITTLEIAAKNVNVSGGGTVTDVKVKETGSNAKIETANTKIEVEKGAEGVKGGGETIISGGSTSTNNNTGTGSTGQPPISGGFIPFIPSYTPVSDISITGTATVGQTLSAAISPSSAAASYQWQRASASGGDYTDIQGATANSYTLTDNDLSKYIRVIATGIGSYTGTVSNTTLESVRQITYTVTFKDWNDSVLDSQTVVKGNSATAPASPSRNGYTFTGWDKTYSNISSALAITAQYSINC